MAKNSNSEVVKPSIRVDGHKHVLESMFDGKKELLPEIKAVGYMRLTEGQAGWVSYVITTKGKEVISIEIDEPNLRQIAEEAAKISFVNTFVDQNAF